MSVPKSLTLNVPDVATLQAVYMPFLERGGLFVPTQAPHELGERVSLRLTLPGEHQAIDVTGEVAWISPDSAASQRAPGVGIHFSLHDGFLCERIEVLLKEQDQDTQVLSYTL